MNVIYSLVVCVNYVQASFTFQAHACLILSWWQRSLFPLHFIGCYHFAMVCICIYSYHIRIIMVDQVEGQLSFPFSVWLSSFSSTSSFIIILRLIIFFQQPHSHPPSQSRSMIYALCVCVCLYTLECTVSCIHILHVCGNFLNQWYSFSIEQEFPCVHFISPICLANGTMTNKKSIFLLAYIWCR